MLSFKHIQHAIMMTIIMTGMILGLLPVLAVSQASANNDKPEVIVYTYDSFAADWGPGPKIKSAFEAQCECTLTFIGLDTSLAVLTRIRLEGENTPADIILGLDTSQLSVAKNSLNLAPHGIAQIDPMLDLPEAIGPWQDEVFIPFDWGYFAFVYDASKHHQVPSSMTELIQSDHPWRIAIQDPRSSTPGFGLMLWMKALYGDKASENWRNFMPKITTITKGWSEAYGLFLDDEVDMVLSYTTSPSYHRVAEDQSQYEYLAFTEGHYTQIEVAAMLASTDQPKLSQQFLAFLLTPEAQSLIPRTNWMYPAVKGIPLPEGFEVTEKPAGLLLDNAMVADKQKQWLDEWIMAVSQN